VINRLPVITNAPPINKRGQTRSQIEDQPAKGDSASE
jgi:hypothetical protein